MVPLWRTYTTELVRSVWQPVRCKFCKCEFAYEVRISASGQGSSALGLISIEAMGRAMDNAETNLQYQMEEFRHKRLKIKKIIPCPDCGRLQVKMIQESKEARKKGLINTFILAAIILLNPLSVSFYQPRATLNEPIKWDSLYTPTTLIPLIVFVIFFLILLIRRKVEIRLVGLIVVTEVLTMIFLNLPVGIALLVGLGIGYLIYQNRNAFDNDPLAYADKHTP